VHLGPASENGDEAFEQVGLIIGGGHVEVN